MDSAPEGAAFAGPNVHKNAPPQSILSKPYFDSPDLGGEIDNPFGGSNGLNAPGMGIMARGRRVPDEPGLSEIVLNNTGSGWLERFLLFTPAISIGQRAPLLVVFHRFGVSHWDAYYNTTFFDEARARGWFVIAPIAAGQKAFSSLEAQINVQAALDWTTTHFNIDTNRVYGVGFSMGGGMATSYAARHVDPNGVMFAAVLNHTGGVSLANTWALEYDDDDADDNTPLPGNNLEVPDILENWFGGPPSAHPFAYQRCSLIDLDPQRGTIGDGTDMSRNLSYAPLRDWMANSDPIQYLRDQTTAFDAHINAQNLNNTMTVVNGTVHNWSTLDDHAVCDWLAQFSLQIPRSASTLADQDGDYFWFHVNQNTAGSFTPFQWVLDPVNDRITLFNTANLQRIALDVTTAGLQYSGVLKINMDTADGTGDEVLLENMNDAPVSVTRDGVPASGSWDPSSKTFLITETDSAVHMWRLNF